MAAGWVSEERNMSATFVPLGAGQDSPGAVRRAGAVDSGTRNVHF